VTPRRSSSASTGATLINSALVPRSTCISGDMQPPGAGEGPRGTLALTAGRRPYARPDPWSTHPPNRPPVALRTASSRRASLSPLVSTYGSYGCVGTSSSAYRWKTFWPRTPTLSWAASGWSSTPCSRSGCTS